MFEICIVNERKAPTVTHSILSGRAGPKAWLHDDEQVRAPAAAV